MLKSSILTLLVALAATPVLSQSCRRQTAEVGCRITATSRDCDHAAIRRTATCAAGQRVEGPFIRSSNCGFEGTSCVAGVSDFHDALSLRGIDQEGRVVLSPSLA